MDDWIIILILLNGVFSMSEVALISARKSKLTSGAKNGNKSASIALDLSNEPDGFLSTVQIGITLIGIFTGLFSGAPIATDLGEYLSKLGVEAKLAMSLSKILIVAAPMKLLSKILFPGKLMTR